MHEPESGGDPRHQATGSRFGAEFSPPAHGPVDRFIRRFGSLSHLLSILALFALASVAAGIALAPALWAFGRWAAWVAGWPAWLQWPALGAGLAGCFFVAGFGLLAVVPVFNFLLPTRIKPYQGGYYTIASVPWCLHNGLFYLVRYTFLPFVTLTPFGRWFLVAMGMKLGQRVFINTEFASDPRMISIGDDAVIGGSVHLFAHFGGAGHLVIAPVLIGARATVGQKATIMGDVQVGAGATILPHSVLLPGSRVGEGEIWGGVPARPITHEEFQHYKDGIHGVAGPGARKAT